MKWRILLVLGILLAVLAGTIAVAWRQSPDESSSWEEEKLSLTPQEHFTVGFKALNQGDFPKAKASMLALENIEGFEKHAQVLRCAFLIKMGDIEAGLSQLPQMTNDDRLRRKVTLLRAEAFYRLNRLVEAEQLASSVLKEDTGNMEAHRWLAAIYYDLGANQAAIYHLNAITKAQPEDFTPHHLLGQIYFDAENYTSAINHLRASLKRNPPDSRRPEIKRYLARSLLKNRQFREIVELVEPSTSDVSLLAIAGEAYWGLGETDRAKNFLKQAQKRDAHNRFVLVLQARMAIEAGNPKTAIEPLKNQLKIDPHDVECRYRLALCYRKLGDLDSYQAEIQKMQTSEELRKQLSKLTDEAITRPRDADIREKIAKLYQKMGREKMAAVYRRAAEECRRISIGRKSE
ncbi:MAG: hypothetical protein Tsb009_11810 [Planctomycetaceae bacterium]